MKIDFISSDGIQQAEKDALERMRQAFNRSPFSSSWQGFAGFEMIDPVHRDREIDLVLLTHDRVLLIELKNWHGPISTMGDHWLLRTNDMGRSPVKVIAAKCKIFAGKMKKFPEPARSAWNEYRVVLCGTEDTRAIPDDEKAFVLRLDEFLKIATEGNYTRVFGPRKSGRPCDQTAAFSTFIRGPEFKPTSFSFNNFQIEGEATFEHPDDLYKEYRSLKRDDPRLQGLLMLNPGVLECWSTPQLHLDVAVRGREKPDDTVRKRFTAYRHPIAQLEDGILRYESSGEHVRLRKINLSSFPRLPSRSYGKLPARSESSNEAKTLGESNSGKQKKSIAPNTLTSAADRMLPMMPCSPIEAVVISSPC